MGHCGQLESCLSSQRCWCGCQLHGGPRGWPGDRFGLHQNGRRDQPRLERQPVSLPLPHPSMLVSNVDCRFKCGFQVEAAPQLRKPPKPIGVLPENPVSAKFPCHRPPPRACSPESKARALPMQNPTPSRLTMPAPASSTPASGRVMPHNEIPRIPTARQNRESHGPPVLKPISI